MEDEGCGSTDLFPTFWFPFQSCLCSTLHSSGFWKALLACKSHFPGFFFFFFLIKYFCPFSVPLWIFHLVFHVLFYFDFFSLHATLLHLGLVLVALLSFSSRPLFPSLNMLFPFLPGHLAFSSSPPMKCYCISWVGKGISVPWSTAAQQALLVWSYCFPLPWKGCHSMWLGLCEASHPCAGSQQFLEPPEDESVCRQGWAALLEQGGAKGEHLGSGKQGKSLMDPQGSGGPLLENEDFLMHVVRRIQLWGLAVAQGHTEIPMGWVGVHWWVPPSAAAFSVLFPLLHSVITAALSPSRAFGGTAKTALKKCPWISVIPVLTGEQPGLLLDICHYIESLLQNCYVGWKSLLQHRTNSLCWIKWKIKNSISLCGRYIL